MPGVYGDSNVFESQTASGDKLYYRSGLLTTTVKASRGMSTIDSFPEGITYNRSRNKVPWIGSEADKYYLTSGILTTTMSDSIAIGSWGSSLRGCSVDGNGNGMWIEATNEKMLKLTGLFTSTTIIDSQSVSGTSTDNEGMGWVEDGDHVVWCEYSNARIHYWSGTFTGTSKTSATFSSIDTTLTDIGNIPDNSDTLLMGVTDLKLYHVSGRFTTTVRDSISHGGDLGGVEYELYGGDYPPYTPYVQETFMSGDGTTDKLYVTSGEFTTTIHDSITIVGGPPAGVAPDMNNNRTIWSANITEKMYVSSGQITTTILDSHAPTATGTFPYDLESDWPETAIGSPDIIWISPYWDKMYLQAGQVTSTITTSLDVVSIDATARGISWDGTNTPWNGGSSKLYLQSGQFSSTMKTSTTITSKFPDTVSFNGTHTPWLDTFDKAYVSSGQFSTTYKTSLDVSGVNDNMTGLESNAGPPFTFEGSASLTSSSSFTSTASVYHVVNILTSSELTGSFAISWGSSTVTMTGTATVSSAGSVAGSVVVVGAVSVVYEFSGMTTGELLEIRPNNNSIEIQKVWVTGNNVESKYTERIKISISKTSIGSGGTSITSRNFGLDPDGVIAPVAYTGGTYADGTKLVQRTVPKYSGFKYRPEVVERIKLASDQSLIIQIENTVTSFDGQVGVIMRVA